MTSPTDTTDIRDTTDALPADDPLLAHLLAAPHLPLYLQQLQHMLAVEQQRRQQFYATVHEGDKAEFINGEIIMHSPVKYKHNDVSLNTAVLLRAFVNKHALGFVGYEKIMVSLSRNDYEPDICFFGREKADHFQPDQMRFPAPDLVVEILSPSTEHLDRTVKFTDYAAHSVAEYWLVDPDSETVEQYFLPEDATAAGYTLHTKARTGLLTSRSVPGFTIPIRALFDSTEQMAALQSLLA